LFGARFRENAARSLLIPRAYPGRRTPLWQQRLKAQSLLEVARRYPQFPVILETYRECLRDVLDVPGLVGLLRRLHTREVSLVEVETQTASPFASSLLFDYVATYMYEGDTPAAERRAVALALDRDLLRELLGQEELRDLIDPGALEQVEDDLQQRSEHLRARSADGLHDVLRRVGELTAEEAAQRCEPPGQADAWLGRLEAERRAVRARVGGEARWLAAEDAGLYRDALGVVPPGGLPEAFLADVPDALLQLARRFARTHGPFAAGEVRGRFGVDAGPALAALERAGELVRGELRPMGTQREWCDPDVLRRLRRASLAALRKEIEPVGQTALARFAPAWQGVDRHAASGAGPERLRDVLAALQGLALPPELWERDVLPRRLGDYSPAWLDELCANGELVWVGAGPLGGRSGRVALYFRDDAPLLGPPPAPRERPDGATHDLIRGRLRRGACFFADLLVENSDLPADELREALWDLVWAGEATNDAFAPLRARRAPRPPSGAALAPRRPTHGRFRGRGRAAPPLQGRWSLADAAFAAAPADAEARRRAWAELLLERHGILTRELVRAEGYPGGFAALYPTLAALETLGAARRGYFVEGLGGAQFALPGAVERLRALEESVGVAGAPALVLAAADPAQLYGAALHWPAGEARPPVRRAGAYVVTVAGRPVLSVEAGGRSLHVLGPGGGADLARGPSAAAARALPADLDEALAALAAAVRAGRAPRLAVEKVDGQPVVASPIAERLAALGFRRGLNRFSLSPGDA
jgi:ATP-dependent Lhr-like helicase